MRTPLTIEQMRETCPAIFATSPSKRASDRYSFIPTIDIVNTIMSFGWFPVEVNSQGRGDKVHAVHSVWFENEHSRTISDFGMLSPQIVLINSHNCQRRFKLTMGFLRKVCSNGLVVGENFSNQTITHLGVDASTLEESVAAIAGEFATVMDSVDRYSQIAMSDDRKAEFADRAMELRFKTERPFDSKLLLATRREADNHADLFTTFNVVQENLMRGGIEYRNATRKTTLRALTNVSRKMDTNSKLWDLMDEFATA